MGTEARRTYPAPMTTRLLGVCGSLQAESANLALLRKVGSMVPSGVTYGIFDGIRDLPLFNPDAEGGPVHPAVQRWREALAGSEAVLIASPEYGHGIPGALKNALDWVIGSGELYRKPVAVTASAPGPERGARGLDAVCATLRAMNARILGGDPIVRGPDFDDELGALVETWLRMAGASVVPD